MRIITGCAKGCKLKAPKGLTTRPTADRVKESLFNILGSETLGAHVLDLFAGSGNLGLEALSRGADRAVFVDQSAESARVIRENAAHTKLHEFAEIIKSDAFSALRRLDAAKRKFQLVFCDPPYEKGLAEKALRILDEVSLLDEEAIIVVEHSSREEFKGGFGDIQFMRSQRYGAATISFFVFRGKNRCKEGEV